MAPEVTFDLWNYSIYTGEGPCWQDVSIEQHLKHWAKGARCYPGCGWCQNSHLCEV